MKTFTGIVALVAILACTTVCSAGHPGYAYHGYSSHVYVAPRPLPVVPRPLPVVPRYYGSPVYVLPPPVYYYAPPQPTYYYDPVTGQYYYLDPYGVRVFVRSRGLSLGVGW